MWHAAILKLRGVPLFPPKVYRLVGGNQKLPDAFAERLGDRVKLNSPVTKIEHGQTGVRVTCRGNGGSVTHEADYLVCAMSAFMLRHIPVESRVAGRQAMGGAERALLPRLAADLPVEVEVLDAKIRSARTWSSATAS